MPHPFSCQSEPLGVNSARGFALLSVGASPKVQGRKLFVMGRRRVLGNIALVLAAAAAAASQMRTAKGDYEGPTSLQPASPSELRTLGFEPDTGPSLQRTKPRHGPELPWTPGLRNVRLTVQHYGAMYYNDTMEATLPD